MKGEKEKREGVEERGGDAQREREKERERERERGQNPFQQTSLTFDLRLEAIFRLSFRQRRSSVDD